MRLGPLVPHLLMLLLLLSSRVTRKKFETILRNRRSAAASRRSIVELRSEVKKLKSDLNHKEEQLVRDLHLLRVPLPWLSCSCALFASSPWPGCPAPARVLCLSCLSCYRLRLVTTERSASVADVLLCLAEPGADGDSTATQRAEPPGTARTLTLHESQQLSTAVR